MKKILAVDNDLFFLGFIRELLEDDETRRELSTLSPLGRLGQPEDVVGLAIFLASDESSFCTGGIYMADGGQTAI